MLEPRSAVSATGGSAERGPWRSMRRSPRIVAAKLLTTTQSVVPCRGTASPSSMDFIAVYDDHAKKIYDYLYYRLRHRETAEDLAATTFTKAWQHFPSYNPEKGPITAWLYRIARNTLYDHFRQTRPTEDIDQPWLNLAAKDDVNATAESREQLAKVDTYLSQLPPRQREIIILRLWDGLTHAEIAELLGATEAAIKMDFSRTIRQLRETIGPLALIIFLANFNHL